MPCVPGADSCLTREQRGEGAASRCSVVGGPTLQRKTSRKVAHATGSHVAHLDTVLCKTKLSLQFKTTARWRAFISTVHCATTLGTAFRTFTSSTLRNYVLPQEGQNTLGPECLRLFFLRSIWPSTSRPPFGVRSYRVLFLTSAYLPGQEYCDTSREKEWAQRKSGTVNDESVYVDLCTNGPQSTTYHASYIFERKRTHGT